MSANTPKTPLRLSGKRQQIIVASETPDCYAKVMLETPRPPKRKNSKHDGKEIKNLTVAVRIRPMNSKELSTSGIKNAVRVDNRTVIIDSNLVSNTVTRVDYLFQYDYVFQSGDELGQLCSSQKDVFLAIGQPLLHQAFQGYNACLFAYGQTGSGKSYSMMGPHDENIDCDTDAGIIPLFCRELFNKIAKLDENTHAVDVNISYFEIYNEKIHDLLSFSNTERVALKVREHPDWGPYVVNLSTHSVKSYEELQSWLILGNKNRATAATFMNENSSRSHSIFAIELSIANGNNPSSADRRSKVSLVDLAGSERLGGLHNNEEKQKESVSINKSLMTLGKVICSLADQRKGTTFVPYRESVLTWLLKESLGGNSLTCMLATITPASNYVDETLATLRYACKARSIVNQVCVNEDVNARLIRELQSEVNRLKKIHRESITISLTSSPSRNEINYERQLEELRKKVNEKQAELNQVQQVWENRFRENEEQQLIKLAECEKIQSDLESRVRVMSNVNEDMQLSPFHTNFLEEVENIMKRNSPCGEPKLNETNHLQKVKECFSNIYETARVLQPYTEKEETLRLNFAKFMKSVQVLESGLENNISSCNAKKAVSFRF